MNKPMSVLMLFLSTALLLGMSQGARADQPQSPDTTNRDTEKAVDKEKDSDAGVLESKRAKIDQMTQEALERLLRESEEARPLYEKAYGYAVFSDAKVSLGLSGSGGIGEAVEKATSRKIYMRMAGAGAAVGLGAQKYHVVFLFEDEKTFSNFVEKGWKAEGSASAVLGNKGAGAQTSFTNGMAVFTLTDKGLALQADLSGTKYWKSDKLNENVN